MSDSPIVDPEFQLMADFILALNEDKTALNLEPAMQAIKRYKDAILLSVLKEMTKRG